MAGTSLSARFAVDSAVDLLKQRPDASALEILDCSMAGLRGAVADFGTAGPLFLLYATELDPPSPFAELLRRAFAPQLDPRDLLLMKLEPDDPELSARIALVTLAWLEALRAFSERYELR